MAGEFKIKNGVVVNNTQPINNISTDGTLTGNSDLTVPTEKAIKTYVDAEVGSIATPNLQAVTDVASTTTNDILVGTAAGDNTTITDGNSGNPGVTMRHNSQEATILFDQPSERLVTNRDIRGGAVYTPTDDKDFVQKKYVDDNTGGSSLWSADSTERLYPTIEYGRTDIGVQGGVDLGGKLNIEAVDSISGDITVAGSDVADANGGYVETSVGSNVWKHTTHDFWIKMIGNWNWVVTSSNDDDWNHAIAFKSSNLTVPNGPYIGHNAHGDLTVATGTGAVYNDALAIKGSMFATQTIKTDSKLLVKGDVSFGRTVDGGVFLGGNTSLGHNVLEINDGALLQFNIKSTGGANLPQCSVGEILDAHDVVTKEYSDKHASAMASAGGGKVHVGDGSGGWIPRSLHVNETSTDVEVKAATGLDMDFTVDTGHHIRVQDPTEDLDVANKKYVDAQSGNDNVQGASNLEVAYVGHLTSIKDNGEIGRNSGGFKTGFGSGKSFIYAAGNPNEFGTGTQQTHIAGNKVGVGGTITAPLINIDDTTSDNLITSVLTEADIIAGGAQSLVTKQYVDSHSGGSSVGTNKLNKSDGSGGWSDTHVTMDDAWESPIFKSTKHFEFESTGSNTITINSDGNGAGGDHFIVRSGLSGSTTNILDVDDNRKAISLPASTQMSITPQDQDLITKEYADAHYSGGGAVYPIDPKTPKAPSGNITAWSASTTYVYEVTLLSNMTVGDIPITQINHVIASNLSTTNFPHVDAFAIAANKVEVRVRVDEWTDISLTGAEIYLKIV